MKHILHSGGGGTHLLYGRGGPSDIFGLTFLGESDIFGSAKISQVNCYFCATKLLENDVF